ncbi:MAG TPA: hypothetical protein VII76_11490 [Acidimicrobiales bacterium]
MSDGWQGPGYWLASDGNWYPPEAQPGVPVEDHWQPSYATPDVGAHWGSYRTATLQPPVERPWPSVDAFAMGPREPARRRLVDRRGLRWGAVVLVALLAAVGIRSAVSGGTPRWDPRVLGIVRFDEQHRGLQFKQPVKVEFLSSSQFDKEVAVPQPTSKADRSAQSLALRELRALGLVHGNINLAASENTLSQSDIVGLYVDSKKTVFVRGTALTPYVRVTLAHELTHALQDQYFDLDKLRQAVKNGDDTALTSLIEGDAVRDENLYEQSLSPAEQQAYQLEQDQLARGAGKAASVPEILTDMLNFPYALGPTFVDALAARGGTAAIDRAFRDPPVSEAQIAGPVEYPIGWKPARVPTPALRAGEHRLDGPSPFGQVSLFEVLGSRLGYDRAWNAVQGWQGDNSLPYRDHRHTCMAIDVAMGSAASATTLSHTALEWAHTIPGATVTRHDSTVDLRSCDPGPKAPGSPTITPSAFDVLSARAGIIDGVMTGNQVDFALGQCVADKVIVGVGASRYSELMANTLSATQQAQLQQLAAASAGSCAAEGIR